MNMDLLIGLVIGLSGSILALIGTLVSNKQNHSHELKMIEKSNAHEIKTSIQQLTLENSFKEYEFKSNLMKEISSETGQDYTIYPYDMYLITYTKIAEFMLKENTTSEDLIDLLVKMESIKDDYNMVGRS